MKIRNVLASLVSATAILAFIPASTAAQTLAPASFWHGPDGQYWKNNYGECWHTILWKPGDVVPGCGYVEAEPPPPPPKKTVRKVERTISLRADTETFFGFDKAVLTPTARQKLSAMMDEVKPFETVKSASVSAHTDRIGTETYNLDLSERRAAAVVDWLVAHGVDPNLIVAHAYGESQPVVTCEGSRVTQALIDCLQPNRRADIEVVVTREEAQYIEE